MKIDSLELHNIPAKILQVWRATVGIVMLAVPGPRRDTGARRRVAAALTVALSDTRSLVHATP